MNMKGQFAFTVVLAAAVLALPRAQGQGFSFRTSSELVNVTATVTDEDGRFVPGLKVEDFEVYEDGKLVTISQFDSERVPVSLGMALDTSGSMAGEKMAAARTAVGRFLYDLLGEQDEVFLYRFDSKVSLVSGWTDDRKSVGRLLDSVTANGGTAMYDAIAESVPLAQKGSRRKKALIVISDGNDMNSRTQVEEARQIIKESEVMVYAIGIDASGSPSASYAPAASASASPSAPKSKPTPSAFPGARAPSSSTGSTGPTGSAGTTGSAGSSGSRARPSSSARLNVDALRMMTDDSGGRTEIIFSARDLDPATAGIANELSRQYFLGYSTSAPRDGKWHTIEVRLKRGNYTIRARRGFTAG
jgi:Ca-activated chloride channel family protein